MDCIFCRIISRQLPSEIIFEDESVIVFKDRYPRARIHFLIVPKKHVTNLNTLDASDGDTVVRIITTAQKIAQQYGHESDGGFRLVSNNGASAGQIIFHMHWHFMVAPNGNE